MNTRMIRSFRRVMAVLLCMLLSAVCFSGFVTGVKAEGETFTITVQPEDAEVSYPQGATFHVEVDHPENVASYQWEMTEGVNVFMLTGTTATTDTLVVPSTMQDDPDMRYRCQITDKNGSQVYSEEATLHLVNKEENKTVLYLCDHAVSPGETLDLSTAQLGSGTVVFHEDGANIDMNNVSFDNSHPKYDVQISPGLGIMLMRRGSEVSEYYFHLNGDCTVTNTFFDPDYNAGGICFNAYFGAGNDGNKPTVVVDGDGRLILKGGSNAVYMDGNFDLYTGIQTEPIEDRFNDGITCFNFYLEKDVTADIRTNGTGVHANGDMYLYEGSVLNINSVPARVSVGPTLKDLIFMVGSIHAEGAVVNIKGTGDPERFVPYGSYLVNMNGIALNGTGSIYADHTDINIELTAARAESQFAANFNGITGMEANNSLDLANGSKVNVRINAEDVNNCAGISFGGIINAEGGSGIDVNVLGTAETFGVEVGRTLTLIDSSLASSVASTSDSRTYGVVCGGADISFSSSEYGFQSTAKNGIAFAADTGETTEEEISYEAGYVPAMIKLSEKAVILKPDKAVFGLAAVPGFGSFIKAETIFAGSDTSQPAQEVSIGVRSGTLSTWLLIAGALLIACGVYALLKNKRNAARESE